MTGNRGGAAPLDGTASLAISSSINRSALRLVGLPKIDKDVHFLKLSKGVGKTRWQRNGGSLCGKSQRLSSSAVVFPKVVKPAAEQGTAHGQQLGSPVATPEHPGLFESLSYHGLAARLDHARANEIAGLAEGLIEHARAVALQVGDLFFGQSAPLSLGGQVGFSLSDDLGDFIFQERPAPLAVASFG